MPGLLQRRLTPVEIVVVTGCVIALLAIVLVIADSIPSSRDRRAKLLKDSTQINMIYRSFVLGSNDFNGRLLTPGLIDRQPFNGVNTPGRGAENELLNHTANLYSAAVMMNYFMPELLISPLERNPNVRVVRSDYNYDAYAPLNGQLWDTGFKMNLQKDANASYAHMPLFGERKKKHWCNTIASASEKTVMIGSRGPKDGIATANSLSCRADGTWTGSVCLADGSAATYENYPVGPGTPEPDDNLFTSDLGIDGLDNWLTISSGVERDGEKFRLILQWD